MIKTKNFFRGIRIRAFYDTEPLKNLLPPNGLSTYMHLVGMHFQKPQKVLLLLCWLDILFSSNHNIHKSSCGLCFWAKT